MTGDLKCPACERWGFSVWERSCTGRPGCVQKGGVEPRVDTPADDGVDWGEAARYLKRNEAALVDLMAKVDDLMIEGAVSHGPGSGDTRSPPAGGANHIPDAGEMVPARGADIVERLRGTWIWSNGRDERLRNEAADEIARLRAEVERLTEERDDAKALPAKLYDAESEDRPSHTSDGIRALDLAPIVAAALAKEGE
jgi:hypothetical protein